MLELRQLSYELLATFQEKYLRKNVTLSVDDILFVIQVTYHKKKLVQSSHIN